MSGWVCSYRSIWDHPFFKGKGMRVAIWHWLLHHAAWKDTSHYAGTAKLVIRRGEVCFSQQQIQDDTGASRNQVRDVVDWLISNGKATKIGANERANGAANVRANAKTILTLEKYEEYQAGDPEGANERANQGATQGPTKEQENKDNNLETSNEVSLSAKRDKAAKSAEREMINEAVRMYRETAKAQDWPNMLKLSKSRQAALRARLRECDGIAGWDAALRRAAASDHCNGDNDRGWVCNFDFLV